MIPYFFQGQHPGPPGSEYLQSIQNAFLSSKTQQLTKQYLEQDVATS